MRDHIGDQQYERLRKTLKSSTGVEIKSLHSTRNYLREILRLDMVYFHRCPKNHIAFCGKYARHLKCPYCNEWWFFEHSKGLLSTNELPESVPRSSSPERDTEWSEYRKLKPNAIYSYIPLIHRLRLLYANATTSQTLQEYILGLQESQANEKRDVSDGDIIASLRREGFAICLIYC